MAGQLTIDTLKASSGVLATQNGMSGIAKAWVTFNGGLDSAGNNSGIAGTIYSAFNVSSITVNGGGDFTVNFTTAMSNINFAVSGNASFNASAAGGTGRYMCGPAGTQSTSSLRLTTNYAYNNIQNVWFVSVVIHGA